MHPVLKHKNRNSVSSALIRVRSSKAGQTESTMTTARTEFLAGVRAELPILLGVSPFGMIYGALAVAAGLPSAAAQAMSAIVFAGSAQFILTQLIATGTPPIVLLLTVLVVNLRHMLYSASVAPYVHGLKSRWKWLLAYLLTDEAYAVVIMRYRQTDTSSGRSPTEPDSRHWYFLGAGLALWSVWQVSTAVGIFLGAQVPPSWSLDFTLPLTFIALMIPALVDRPAVAAALTAGLVAVIGAEWPYKTGLVAAALAGIIVGALLEARTKTETHSESTGLTESSMVHRRPDRQSAERDSESDSVHPADPLSYLPTDEA
jgi:4-azaleucine resistance transporter AzlC